MAIRVKEQEIFPNAAGIDVGVSSHWVAVPAGSSDEPVREFGAMTDDLNAMATWLIAYLNSQIDFGQFTSINFHLATNFTIGQIEYASTPILATLPKQNWRRKSQKITHHRRPETGDKGESYGLCLTNNGLTKHQTGSQIHLAIQIDCLTRFSVQLGLRPRILNQLE